MSQREGPGEISGFWIVGIWFSRRSAALRGMCDKAHCYGARAKCSFIFPALPLHGIHQTLQNINMKGIIHCLSYGYKGMVH